MRGANSRVDAKADSIISVTDNDEIMVYYKLYVIAYGSL